MIRNNRIIKNASWIVGANIIRSIIGFVISMLTARYLGPSNYGLINYAASIVAFVAPIMTLGINNVLIQEFVANPNREGEIVGTSVLMCLGSTVICILGVFSFAAIANAGERETIIVCLLYSITLFFQATELIRYWFQAKLLAKYSSIVSLVVYLIVSIYKIYLLVTEKSVYWFAITAALDYFLISIGLFCVYKKLGGSNLLFSLSEAKRLFKKSKFYIISGLMVTVFVQTDRVMLKLMLGVEYTGYYSVAVTCATLSEFIFVALIDSARPVIFESYNHNHEYFKTNISRLYGIITYLSLAQCIVITAFAPFIVKTIYGNAYLPAAEVLRLVVWYTTFSYYGPVRGIWMLAEGQQKYLLIINLVGALSNVFLNFVLIPILGIIGAALASVITQFFTNVVMGFIVKPIRENNDLLLKGIDPRFIKKLLQSIKIKSA